MTAGRTLTNAPDNEVRRAVAPTRVSMRRPGRRTDGMRPEVQALRALAVTLVLLYHLWPRRLTGGYVGVDVFFVISGFLITSHLLREVARTGSVDLAAFWARRARRLLPAAMLVLVAVGGAVLVTVPSTFWRQFFSEIAAAAVYGENWFLASQAVDYLGSANSASPVQHYWSLSAEEQFYLLWPLLILAATFLARRQSVRTRTVVIGAVLGTLTLASFVVSVIWTAQVPASAYFATPTRVWEFGAGGLLGLLIGHRDHLLPPRAATAMSWLGVGAICASAVTLTGASPFPGATAAVPVAGTLAVILAGNPAVRWSPGVFGRPWPVQRLGDLSYAVYLWHWPLIVLVPFVTGAPLAAPLKVAIAVASIVLAKATQMWVENPFRFAPRLVRSRPAWSLVGAVVTAALVVAGCQSLIGMLDRREAQEATTLLLGSDVPCFGAAALDPAFDCVSIRGTSATMTPAFAKTDTNLLDDPAGGWQCETVRGSSDLRRCTLGVTENPTRSLAMLGDSHAMHFMEAVRAVADAHSWQVTTYFKSACNGTGAADVVHIDRLDDQVACAEWGRAVIDEIAANPAIDTVIMANVSSAYSQSDGEEQIQPERYATAWEPLLDAGKRIVAVADVPRTVGQDVPDCLAQSSADESVCDAALPGALPFDALATAAASLVQRGVSLLDLTDRFCAGNVCPARVGGVVVYSDSSHITRTYAKTLAPYFEAVLVEE